MQRPRSRVYHTFTLVRSVLIGLALIAGLAWLVAAQTTRGMQVGAAQSGAQSGAQTAAQPAQSPGTSSSRAAVPQSVPAAAGDAEQQAATGAASQFAAEPGDSALASSAMPPAVQAAMAAVGMAPAGTARAAFSQAQDSAPLGGAAAMGVDGALAEGTEIAVSKWLPNNGVRPGGVVNFGIGYQNIGVDGITATNTIIVDTMPLSTTYIADNSEFTHTIGAGGVITWFVGDVLSDSNGQFVVTLGVGADVPEGNGSLPENCVDISMADMGVDDPNNNHACSGAVDVHSGEVDFGVDMWANPGNPAPGQEFTYDIRVCNNRDTAAGPVTLTDTLPISSSLVSWYSDNTWAVGWKEVGAPAGQFVLATAGYPSGLCDTIHVRLLLDASVALDTNLTSTVVVNVPDDVDSGNDEATNSDARTASANYELGINEWLDGALLVPGGAVHYGANVWNGGNMPVSGVRITATLPAGTSYQVGSAQFDGQALEPDVVTGSTLAWHIGDAAVATSANLFFTLGIDTGVTAGTVLTNCVTIAGAESEGDYTNNTQCLAYEVFREGPNLRITKESWWNSDSNLGYRLHFYNVGSQTVNNVWITDTLPTGTTWDTWYNFNFDGKPLQSPDPGNPPADDVLGWQLSSLDPGAYGQIEYNASLDEPSAPLEWFTNTVEIAPLTGDTNPDDNSYEDVAFTGGEVERVELQLGSDHGNMWGKAVSGAVTITTPYTQVTTATGDGCGTCWNYGDVGPLWPGDVVTVEAGSGLQPVVIDIPDTFDATPDSTADEVRGQVTGATQVIIDGKWTDGHQVVGTNAAGEFTASFTDVPRGAMGSIHTETTIDYADVLMHRDFYSEDLLLRVNYDHDWVNANYAAGHTVWITLTDAISTVKATAELETGSVPGWKEPGFQIDGEDWSPSMPNIEPGDWVYGATDTGYTTTVQVGTINGVLDIDANQVTGTISATWLGSDPVTVRCEAWDAPGGASTLFDSVTPDGSDVFSCAWGGEWDIVPGQNVGVAYAEPDGDEVYAVFRGPVPHLRVNTWLEENNVGEGGNTILGIEYCNDREGAAEDVTITDTLSSMTYISDTSGFAHTGSGGEVTWNLGTVAPNSCSQFLLYAQVDAVAGATVTNAVDIATGNPYDEGDPGEKHAEWSGEVQAGDTQLNVGVGAWTGDPAAGESVVFSISACNNGGTGSTQVTLTNTLHLSMTLQSWWYDNAGWSEVSRSAQELVLTNAVIGGGRCENVYVRALVAADAWNGMFIDDGAVIFAANDLNGGDNEATWQGNIGDPHTNLYVENQWGYGQLVSGGELHYNVHYQNNGNVPVGTFRITDTLPAGATFRAAWIDDESNSFTPVLTGSSTVAWEIDGLDNGYSGNFTVALDVSPDAEPGDVLTNTVEITPLSGEDGYEDNVSVWTETLLPHGANVRVFKNGQWDDWGEETRRASYTLQVQNVGDEAVGEVAVTDVYPAGMRMDGGIGGNYWRWWDWRDNGDHFTMTLELLEPGWSTVFNFALIDDTNPLPSGLVFTNTAEISLAEDDTNPDDDTATAVLTTGPDLWVQKDLTAGELLPGEYITYSLSFGNKREGWQWWWAPEGNAVLTDTLPAELEFISARQHWCGKEEGDWCEHNPEERDGNTLVWNLWQLHPSEWNEIVVTARIKDTATGLDTFTNTAEIGSREPVSDTEVDYADNVAGVTSDIALPSFTVSKVYESSRVAGTPITYTLAVTNSGNVAATDVILGDKFPTGFTYTGSDGVRVNNSVQFTFATLAAEGGTDTGWVSGLLPCTTGTFTNDDYAVIESAEEVTSTVGAPVSLTIKAPTLAADFDSDDSSVVVSTTVAFTDASTTDGSAIADWAWSFGDGDTSDQPNPSHTFDSDGVYIVRLTITDGCAYTDTVTATVTVSAPALVASFDQGATGVVVGTTVAFTDTSTTDGPAIDEWAWDFGDGGSSTAADPTHTFNTVGTYTVTLAVTDTLGYSDSTIGTVTVTPACTPLTGVNFTFTPANPLVNSSVSFTATVTPIGATAPTFGWSFGDGMTTTVTTHSVRHTYTTAGSQSVQLTAVNACTPAGVQVTHAVVVDPYRVFLPLALRN